MPYFRKKLVVVEARQLGDTKQSAKDVADWIGLPTGIYSLPNSEELVRVRIATLEGSIEASPFDWVIKGVEGEFYPVRPSIFVKTYEYVGEEPNGD